MGFFLKFLQGFSSVFRSKSILVNSTLLYINKLTNDVICKLLRLLHQCITHKNKTSIFSKIIEISSCFLLTAVKGGEKELGVTQMLGNDHNGTKPVN